MRYREGYGLTVEDGPEADDEVLDVNGVTVFVDPFSAQYLEGVPRRAAAAGAGAHSRFDAPPGLTNGLGALT